MTNKPPFVSVRYSIKRRVVATLSKVPIVRARNNEAVRAYHALCVKYDELRDALRALFPGEFTWSVSVSYLIEIRESVAEEEKADLTHTIRLFIDTVDAAIKAELAFARRILPLNQPVSITRYRKKDLTEGGVLFSDVMATLVSLGDALDDSMPNI